MKPVSNRVRELRMKALMSQKELAEKANMKQPVLCRIENGSNPSIMTAMKIANALGVSLEDIFLPQLYDNSRTNRSN